jgi:hypothetical protein
MQINVYRAYGLCIHSGLDCPEFSADPQGSGEPDVTIRLLPPAADAIKTLANGHYEVGPGFFRLAVPGVAQYRVEEGRRIFIQPLPGVPLGQVRLFLLGSALGALLYQRGLFPLHGSAVETPWGAMIFVGAQGAGKSTLAAQFLRQGYRLLSDDVCAVSGTGEGLRILPALAHFRLCTDAFERLGMPVGGRFDVDKFVVPMGEGYCPNPVPLRAIHILGDQESDPPRFEVLRGLSKVQRLLENIYRPHFLKGQSTQSDLVRMAGRIAQETTMAAVTRRRDILGMQGMVRFLESEWTQRFSVSTLKENN